ncbi:hypothetical protein DUNSADRAFT_6872 [Dunaliella salina]|nr:hypothetical protein DUNSADRAFT_6872 [Dunaliella salina]|eukprot:KAF5835783.1 hypothetical protein DUNSADRAFT_6872 [Dunaliella salina]
MNRLAGHTALVTGGARGIGLGIARTLGLQGAKVMAADVEVDQLKHGVEQLQAQGINAAAAPMDVRERAQVERAVQEAAAFGGGQLNILVANAGVLKAAPFLETSDQDFSYMTDVNLKGCFISCQAAARQMVKQKQENPQVPGSIVALSSMHSAISSPTFSAYDASKGGVTSLTRSMALALACHNIRVNAVGPGPVTTYMEKIFAGTEESVEKIKSQTPLRRFAEPEEIGHLVAFLASEEASFITGQTIYADGGALAQGFQT